MAIQGCDHCGYTRLDAALVPGPLPVPCPECSRTLRMMNVQEGRLLAAERAEADVYKRQSEAFLAFRKVTGAKR